VLCASDRYPVAGAISALQYQPDLVSGRATSTDAAIALVARLCGLPAINLIHHHNYSALDELLERCLKLDPLPTQFRADGAARQGDNKGPPVKQALGGTPRA
jgi:hypothetical protein